MATLTPTRIKAQTSDVVAACPNCDDGTMKAHVEGDLVLGSGATPRSVVAKLDRQTVRVGLECARCGHQLLVDTE